MYKNVLLPIEPEDQQSWSKALPAARALVGDSGTIHLMGVVHDVGSSMVATFLPRGFEVKALEAMKESLESFAEQHLQDVRHDTIVGHGHVAETILKHAARLGVDLIVMASHKPDELRSILISSHANAVVRHSPVSVMVVR